ncbi:MAG: four-carbon acid sugar kinase family protein, partial [Bryobacterales bacterium]|nr:four-carbon acid sugar kinase family protein [Bryobacterales bacterium]
IDELLNALDASYTVAVPALPVNGRTQYLGHLFVNGVLLNESPMRHHPLNPMTDANLVRWLQRQTSRRVGLVALPDVQRGRFAVAPGVEIALVDAVTDADLVSIAEAVCDLPLITGGSGLAMRLPGVWRSRGLLAASAEATPHAPARPGTLILAGSCSAATLDQLRAWEESGYEALSMNVADLGPRELARLEQEARAGVERNGVALIRSSAPPEERVPGAAEAVEQAFAELAKRLAPAVDKLIVAGGETAGAVVDALQLRAVELTAILDPGVPALRSVDEPHLHLALKSGNFGSRDFFSKALHHA